VQRIPARLELPCADERSEQRSLIDGGAIVLTWFKRFALVGGIVIVLELVAWVGIATLGPDAFRRMIAFYDPRPEQAEIVEQRGDDGSLQRCALYRGELLCIGDEGDGRVAADDPETATATTLASAPAAEREHGAGPAAQRCASFEGQTICIKEGT
jgi:hypothetical protein